MGKSTRKYRNEYNVPSLACTVGYKNSWSIIPSIPNIEVASPTVAAGIPRPPVKVNGRETGESGAERGVERKSDQRFVNAPRWKSKNAVVIKVKITFFVKIRWKGRVRVGRAFSLKSSSSGGGLWVSNSTGSELRMEYLPEAEFEVKRVKALSRRCSPMSNFPLRDLRVWEVLDGLETVVGKDEPLRVRRKRMRLSRSKRRHSARQVVHRDIFAAIASQMQHWVQTVQEALSLDLQEDLPSLPGVSQPHSNSELDFHTWTQNSSNVEAHRQNQESSRLILLLLRNLRNHGSSTPKSVCHPQAPLFSPSKLLDQQVQTHMIPTVPLIAPPNALQIAAWTKVVANPYPKQLTAVPSNPTKSTIFLPPLLESAAFPHNIAVATCAPVKHPCIIPA
jgi:hypothetical protein